MMHRSHAAAALLLLPPVFAQQQPEPAAQDRVALDLRITAAGWGVQVRPPSAAGPVTIDVADIRKVAVPSERDD